MSYVVVIFLPVWAEGDCVRLHSCYPVIEFVLNSVSCYNSLLHELHNLYVTCYYSITIVQRYTGKYRKLVSVCIVQVSSMQQASDIASGIAWYYGDNDLITIRTFNFIACSDAVHMTSMIWILV